MTQPLTAVFLALAAELYGGPPAPALPDPVADKVAAAFLSEIAAAKLRAPRRDGRLDAFARALASAGAATHVPGRMRVEHELRAAGLVDPTPHLAIAAAVPESVDLLARDLARGGPHTVKDLHGDRVPLRFGVGTALVAGVHHAVIATTEHALVLRPIPRRLPASGTAWVAAVLEPHLDRPTLIVQRADGTTTRTRMQATDAGHAARLRCTRDGTYRVEIVAHGPFGPEVAANFPVYCGAAPPTEPPPEPAEAGPPATEAAAEAAMVAAIAADRRRAGVPPLERDPRLDALARAHSLDMRARGYVGHRSPSGDTAVERARRASLRVKLIAENVGRARSVADAELGFLESPGHRENLLLPDATHVGVGVSFLTSPDGSRELLVTQLFARY